MSISWIDVSIPLHAGMAVWPGDPQFEMSSLGRIGGGASCNTSRICMATHTGTHVDAPWHFDDAGPRLDQVDTALFFGEATVFDLAGADEVVPADLGASPLPPRILFKTRNSGFPCVQPFREDFVAVGPEAAQRLVDEGVRLVGIDYLSIAPFRQESSTTHHILLGNGVLVVEGLRLGGLRPGVCQFVVLPLPIAGADGAPCRAFAGLEVLS